MCLGSLHLAQQVGSSFGLRNEEGRPGEVANLRHRVPGSVPSFVSEGPPLLVGDVVIAPDYIRRQAGELGMTVDDEMALMVAHGILHLLGYDHQDDADAELMEDRERVILASQGRSRR